MNQVFSISRFWKLISYNLRTNQKLALLLMGGATIALLIIQIVVLNANKHSGFSMEVWRVLFMFTYVISGTLLIGHAFPYLRKKESRASMLVLPASTLEKFLFEFVVKFVLFSVVFSVLFMVVSFFSTNIVEYYNKIPAFRPFKFEYLVIENPKGAWTAILMLLFFVFTVAFAGASAFRRWPLIKTLLFVGGLVFCTGYYIYFVMEKLDLDRGIGYALETNFKNELEAFNVLYVILAVCSLTALSYAFFKLKEKEV